VNGVIISDLTLQGHNAPVCEDAYGSVYTGINLQKLANRQQNGGSK